MSGSYRPLTLDELLNLMNTKDLIPFAGGTDLMVQFAGPTGPEFPKDVAFVGHLSELTHIKRIGSELIIGSAATLTSIMEHEDTPEILKSAILLIAAPALRNRGTMGGNICNASPAGDSIPPLYVLGAKFCLLSSEGERIVEPEDFFKGPGRTDRKKNEILKEVRIPLQEWNITRYRKVGTRAANALTKCSISAAVKTKQGRIDDLAIAFGAVGPVIVRDKTLEKNLIGQTVDDVKGKIPSILNDYSAIIVPIDDQRSTAEYRKQVSLNLLKSFLENDLV